jgi:hypothetical protein
MTRKTEQPKTEHDLLNDLISELNAIKVGHVMAIDVLVKLGSTETKHAGEHDWAFMAGALSASGRAIDEVMSFIENLGIARLDDMVRDQEAGIDSSSRQEGTTEAELSDATDESQDVAD